MKTMTTGVAAANGTGRGRRVRGRGAALLVMMAGAVAITGGLLGCRGVDGWLWDPSVVGRWEETPTITPILDRIDVIEADSGDFVDVTGVRSEDLIPQPIEYRVSPGDFLVVSIFEFQAAGLESQFELPVDNRGFISVPRLDPIRVEGLTATQIQQAVAAAIIEANILRDPIVTVTVPGQRQATFAIYGGVPGVGRYPIPYPDYRLLDALTDSGGISQTLPYVFVIRQVTLDEDGEPVRGLPPADGAGRPDPAGGDDGRDGDGEELDIDDLLERLSEPDGGATGEPTGAAMSSADERSSLERQIQRLMQDVDRAAAAGDRPASPSLAAFQDDASDDGGAANGQRPEEGGAPVIDLDDEGGFDTRPEAQRDEMGEPADPLSDRPGEWVFIDGEWKRVSMREARRQGGLPEAADPLANAEDGGLTLVTERVIRIPTKPLREGVAKFNIVIRPGDLISVPIPDSGNVYVAGPGVARPGVYTLSPNTRLTMRRLVASAGGFSAIGVPERVDLVRMVGENRQATIRLDVRAIFEGTAPDIVIKRDDLVNFGTSFWSTPLAVIRGGFRASYGFGFLLDRNFGNDVFGAPPSDRDF